MNMNYDNANGIVSPRTDYYRHFGGLHADDAGTDYSVTVDLVFRMTTNGVTVTTEANAEPIITTSAGQFN